MNCKEINELLTAYLDCELSPEESEQVRQHLLVCPLCREDLDELEVAQAKLRQALGIAAVCAGHSQRTWNRIEKVIKMDKSKLVTGKEEPVNISWGRRLAGLFSPRPVWKPVAIIALAIIIIVSLLLAIPPTLGSNPEVQAAEVALNNPDVISAFGDEPIESATVTEETDGIATVEVIGRQGTLVTLKVDLNSGTVMDTIIFSSRDYSDEDLEKLFLALQSDETIKELFDQGATIVMIGKYCGSTTGRLINVRFVLGDELYSADIELPSGELLGFEKEDVSSEGVALLVQLMNERKEMEASTGEIKYTIPDIVVHDSYSDSVLFQNWELDSGRSVWLLIREEGYCLPEGSGVPEGYREAYRSVCALEKGEPVEYSFAIAHSSYTSVPYLISVFVDFEQVEFELDGEYGLLHEINAPPDVLTMIPINIGVLSEGVHDIQICAFEDPYNMTLDHLFRMSMYGYMYDCRTLAKVGDVDTPALELEVNTVSTPVNVNGRNTLLIGFAYVPGITGVHTSNPTSSHKLYIGQGEAGQPYQFQIYANYNEYYEVPRAIMVLLDYHQVKFDDTSVFVANLQQNEQAVIDLELVLPEEEGVHQVQAIWVPDPYEPDSRGIVERAYGSPRIAVIVE